MKTEAEMDRCLPGATRSWGWCSEGSSLGGFEETAALPMPGLQTSSLQNWERISVLFSATQFGVLYYGQYQDTHAVCFHYPC